MKQLIFLISIIMITIESIAQYKLEDLSYLHEKHKGQDAVTLYQKDAIEISFNEQKEILITNKHSEATYFLSKNAEYYSDSYIFYNSFSEIRDINAYYFAFNGKSYKKQKIENFHEENRYSKSVFYDDNKTTKILFPKVNQFDQTQVSYTEITKDPHLMNNYYFCSYIPMEEVELSITFPHNVKIKYKVFNDPDNKIKFETRINKGLTTYTWKLNNAKKYKLTDDSFSISYFMPHVAVYIDEYTLENKTTKVTSDVRSLYNWYYSLVKDVNKEETPDLKQLTDSLISGKTTEIEKIKAIYYWVQSNINYIAFEDGYSGFIPREAKDIFHKRYGDCKDMASIMHEMFSYTDIPAYLTWIGTRDIPYTYEELPTVGTDNHMILTVKSNDSLLFLDGTAQYLSISLPSSFIQGKEALIGINENEFLISKVPVIEMNKSYTIDTTIISIKDETTVGKSVIYLDGYDKFYQLRSLNRATSSNYKKLISSSYEKGSNKFKLDTFKILNKIDRDLPFVLSIEFKIPDYHKKVNNDYYINMNLDRPLLGEDIDTSKASYGIMENNKSISHYITILEIPSGYSITKIPETVEYNNDLFGFKISYKLDKDSDKLIMDKIIEIKTLTIPESSFNQWNTMISELSKSYNQAIKLKKNQP